ncbi:hypothetical protein OIE66_18025 [Nonomuraea sp. NBC_01738]|uniref:hypothetical protein n=1 Tax=Nonomuraea sp. NBC_01738 TaxID=2976003 RepID=UPI002E122314|nr:hypothetical protein OIE66_18025 [Nonomuraea sp. NBC_01738]
MLVFGAIGAATGGAGAALIGQARGADGFVRTGAEQVITPTHALTAEEIQVYGQGVRFPRSAVGQVRVTVSGSPKPLFVTAALLLMLEAALLLIGIRLAGRRNLPEDQRRPW